MILRLRQILRLLSPVTVKDIFKHSLPDFFIWIFGYFENRVLLFSCNAIFDNETNSQLCQWDYTGQGLEYQILAGPIYVVIFTTSGVIMGYIGDKVNRLDNNLYEVLTCHLGFVIVRLSIHFSKIVT